MARALVNNIKYKPNLLINGGMDYWQRSTTPAGVGTGEAYNSVDRWRIRGGGAGANTITRSTDVPSGVGLTYSVSNAFSGTAGSANMVQPIEAADVLPYIGRTLCFSAWVKAGAGLNTGLLLAVYIATGGVDVWPSSIVASPGSIYAQTTVTPTVGVWQRVSFSFVVPASASNGLAFRFGWDCSTAGTHLVAGAMVTEGTQPPAQFYNAAPNVGAELALCQRYFTKSYNLDVAIGTNTSTAIHQFGWGVAAASGVVIRTFVTFRVEMRTSPAVVAYRGVGTVDEMDFFNNAGTFVGSSATSYNPTSAGVRIDATTAVATAFSCRYHWSASAEL